MESTRKILVVIMLSLSAYGLSACGKKVDRTSTDTSPVQPQDPQIQNPNPYYPPINPPNYPTTPQQPYYPQYPSPQPGYGNLPNYQDPCLPPSYCDCFPVAKKSVYVEVSIPKSKPKKEYSDSYKKPSDDSSRDSKKKKPKKPVAVQDPSGLSGIYCTIYDFKGRSYERLPDLAFENAVGSFKLTNFNIKETDGEKGFPGAPAQYKYLKEHYGLSCQGTLTVATGGEIKFKLKSDDGARVTLDSRTLISKVNDGDDSESEKMFLSAGDHSIQIEWYQKTDNVQLQLYWDRKGKSAEIIRARP